MKSIVYFLFFCLMKKNKRSYSKKVFKGVEINEKGKRETTKLIFFFLKFLHDCVFFFFGDAIS